jgi:hypothetical protein
MVVTIKHDDHAMMIIFKILAMHSWIPVHFHGFQDFILKKYGSHAIEVDKQTAPTTGVRYHNCKLKPGDSVHSVL